MPIIVDNLLKDDDLSQMGKPFAEAKVNILNQEKRLPTILLVDTSGSMRSYKSLLKDSVEGVYDSIFSNRKASNVIELGVMTFNSEIQVLEKLREIKLQKSKGKNLDFECNGVTLTGLAVKAALAHLRAREVAYEEAKPAVHHYAPILFFISDGKPECYDDAVKPQEERARRESIAYIRKVVAANQLVVISVEVGDYCDHSMMVQLTGLDDDRHVIKVNNGIEFSKFFQLSSSVIISSSQTGSEGLNARSFKEDFEKLT